MINLGVISLVVELFAHRVLMILFLFIVMFFSQTIKPHDMNGYAVARMSVV